VDDYHKSVASARDITQGLSGVIQGLGRAMRTTGTLMTAGAGIAGAAIGSLSMRIEEVNSAFREVESISREVTNAQEEYSEVISDLNTQFGLQESKMQVIDGLYQSVSAGIQEGAEAQREFLETAAQLAVVGRVELATTVDVLSTVMNTYGLETEKTQAVAESLFQTVQYGKVRMEELAPVLGRVAALGSEMNVTIDQIGTGMAVLTRTGFEARVAATGLRNVFRSMMKPSEAMQQMLRDIALEQNLFAESMSEGAGRARSAAEDYRSLTNQIDELTQTQKEARSTVEDSSLAIQEARLKITAIEEGREDQLKNLTNEQVRNADSISELESIINNYRFEVNQARVQEEQARLEQEKLESQLSNTKKQFSEQIAAAGDLEGNVGSLVLENQNLVDTLVQMREKADEQGVAFSELFPRTRSLQAALALVGENGQLLTSVFSEMRDEAFNPEEFWESNRKNVQENFENFEAFKEEIGNIQEADLESWYQNITGEQQKMRNAVSEMTEEVKALGRIFNEDFTQAISNISDSVGNLANRATNLSDAVKENISQFAILGISIGLVLGPLLFFTGQMVVMASMMGTMFIPFLGIAGALLGVFAAELAGVVSGGESANSTFESMRSFLDGLIWNLRFVGGLISDFIIPPLRTLAGTSVGIFGQIASNIGEMVSNGQSLPIMMVSFAVSIREAINAVNAFLKENEKLIVTLVSGLAAVIINEIIPAFIAFAKGAWAVLSQIDWSLLVPVAKLIGAIAIVIARVVGWIGRWMQNNSGLIATFIEWTAKIAVVVGSILGLVSAIGFVYTWITGLIASIKLFIVFVGIAVKTIGFLSTAFALISSIAPSLATGITLLSTAFGYLSAAVGTLVSIISLPMVIIGGLIVIIGVLIATAWLMRDEIVSAVKDLVNMWIKVFLNLWKALTGQISWKQAGKNIILAFVNGITGALGHLKKGLKKVVNTVKGYLGFGSSPEALGEEYNPKNYGENVSASFSEGMLNNKPKVKSAGTDISETVKNSIDTDMNIGEDGVGKAIDPEADLDQVASQQSQRQPATGMPGQEKIVIDEKAIYFEKGAFQGVADDEIPDMVEDEIDESLDEIVEDVRAKGADPN
jgi:TP901 family phage tail tape measure protein